MYTPPPRSPQPVPRFVLPTLGDMQTAARIVDSHPVIASYTASEWSELNDDGKVWIASIVREAMAEAAQQPRPIPADVIVEINAFLSHMADRFRARTAFRVLGFRVHTLGREEAMQLALCTYDATLDMMNVPFGHPDHAWDRAAAYEFVDLELQHWEA